MEDGINQKFTDELTEKLAGIEHERWSHWQRYVHGKCERKPDGSLVIPSELVAQWERQIETPYANLSESEKESDRDQVRRYLAIVLKALGTRKPLP
jgi:hypothetical protein